LPTVLDLISGRRLALQSWFLFDAPHLHRGAWRVSQASPSVCPLLNENRKYETQTKEAMQFEERKSRGTRDDGKSRTKLSRTEDESVEKYTSPLDQVKMDANVSGSLTSPTKRSTESPTLPPPEPVRWRTDTRARAQGRSDSSGAEQRDDARGSISPLTYTLAPHES